MSATNHAILSWLYNNDFFGILKASIFAVCFLSRNTCIMIMVVNFAVWPYIHVVLLVVCFSFSYIYRYMYWQQFYLIIHSIVESLTFMFFAKFWKGRDQKTCNVYDNNYVVILWFMHINANFILEKKKRHLTNFVNLLMISLIWNFDKIKWRWFHNPIKSLYSV